MASLSLCSNLLSCVVLFLIAFFGHASCYDNNQNDRITNTDLTPIDAATSSFNVVSYGAKGDGKTDDSKAFFTAFQAACKVQGGVVYVPAKYNFLLLPITFAGDTCQSNIVFQVDGTITAPDKSGFKGSPFQWILFKGFAKGLTLKGNGVFEGRGQLWWSTSKNRPNAILISGSTNVVVTGITIKNSPLFHLYLGQSQYVKVYSVTVSAPEDSPNTDGIHLTYVQHAEVYSSTIASGDDCVSVQAGTSDARIHDINCGPGHGYSIGGLGPPEKPNDASVQGVSFYSSNVKNALYGVRIKTWRGGIGSAKNISFSDIIMTDVKNAIIIDQNYCDGSTCGPNGSTNAVAISDVYFKGITGTYSTKAVDLECSSYKPCQRITVDSVQLKPSTSKPPPAGADQPTCAYAYGKVVTPTTPSFAKCLLS